MMYRIRKMIALAIWALGCPPKISTEIGGFISRGYGKLDEYGYFTFPLNKYYGRFW